MFKNAFLYNGRITRTEFGLSSLIAVSCFMSLLMIASKYTTDPRIPFFSSLPILWFCIAQGAKRCHDIGESGWKQFIPFHIFALLFEDSHIGINQYGLNPKGLGNEDDVNW